MLVFKFFFRLIQWMIFLPLHIILILSRYPMAPIAVILFSTSDKLHLKWFKYLETLDNDLTGDSGWRNEHIKPGSDPLSTWNRIGWLWRNGGNAVNYKVLGCKYGPCKQLSTSTWINDSGYWLLRKWVPMFGKYLEIFVGWGLNGNVVGYSKFTATIRMKANKQ